MILLSQNLRRLAVVLGAALVASSCAGTAYVDLGKDETMPGSPIRTVGVQVDRALIDEFPDCTIILEPETAPELRHFSPLVEEALGRYLSRKFTRVIDGLERRKIVRKAALDLRHREDLGELAVLSGCDTFFRSRIVGPGETYLVVWSKVQVGIEITMVRARDQKMLWRARHSADRAEGGVPFSPIGLVFDAYSSARFSSDREVAESVIDDAVRRLVRSAPNFRKIEANVISRR